MTNKIDNKIGPKEITAERRAYKTAWMRKKRQKEGVISRRELTLLHFYYREYKKGNIQEARLSKKLKDLKDGVER